MEGLFNPVSILLHVMNAALLFVVLYFLLYKPVHRYMQSRRDGIQAELEDAQAKQQAATEAQEASQKKLAEAEAEASRTIAASAQQAQQRAQEILDHTQDQAAEIVEHAHTEAESVARLAKEAMQDQTAELAVSMTEKLLKQKVADANHDELIHELLERL